jgi:hypothetical protein
LTEKSAYTYFLTAGKVENGPCGHIKKNTFVDTLVLHYDNIAGIKYYNRSIFPEFCIYTIDAKFYFPEFFT